MTNLREFISTVPTGIFLGGAFEDREETFDVINPSDGSVLTKVASASQEDATRALDLATSAQGAWAATPARERGEILRKTFELLIDATPDLTLLMSAELGRALPDSKSEVAYGAEFFRWFSEEAVRIRGDYRHSPAGNARIVEIRQPVGPSLAITPWNFPLAMGARKIAPALAAGCTIIVKPASKTPLTMLYLAKVLKEAGLPDGVLAVLPTSKSSRISALLDDPRLRKFTFTGSTEVGQSLAAQGAGHSLKTSLELGGNAPYVVLEDADLPTAIDAMVTAKMRGAGQVCIAANRFLVHSSIKDEFVAGCVEKLKQFRVGNATDEGTTVGPLSGEDQLEIVTDLVDDALEKGATKHFGELPDGLEPGFYYPPSVLSDIPAEAAIASSEIFGPVIAVTTFDTDEEAIRLANNTPFGLAAYVFSENLTRALSVAEAIEAGMVAVNKGALSDPAAPFGGVKESGLGREGGFQGIDEFLEVKFISLPL
ncbi:Putative succinate-semialdehyde dehydrogenase [NADP(+)] [Corynebacterium deserti GIMN1.010]|uniref:Putative succinate-semialdehyde dehydrogenase [NADP(+)] n=1 Tax=Corynebacterium deserti GIMN1.010 TaxID=931089 RepID=A0A0M4CD24_9CORY|nr:NAD-dependent succinate-semialdehyde dehydrogenase [Corynebacterium deserti]ALC05304.1 Putative succinate-semialdehyde dehydrogenase [NADP(+)] [Corynebacterium deserti GIMN1.010]